MGRKAFPFYRLLTRKDLEANERTWLAPYAVVSSRSQGRRFKEAEHPYRTCFERDRDRIIHCTAFRRLEYKTQVFVIHEGDYYRTRLTHTLEVAQIAVTVAKVLRLNTHLVEAIALAHDLGHGPFGHSGEQALRMLMADHGGFDHNLQALRIVDLLEERYPDFPGLNLTWEVRDGLNKHRARLEGGSKPTTPLSLEAQVVDMADEVAYDHHDLDDGITSGLFLEEDLRKIPLWRMAHQRVRERHPRLNREVRKYSIIRRLIDLQVTDLIEESMRRLARHGIRRAGDVQRCSDRLIGFSDSMKRLRRPLKTFLAEGMYHHYKVVRMADKARRFLTALFEVYIGQPEQLPDTTRRRLEKEEPRRVICDYIAGMTDRYALEEYQKLFHPF